MFNDTFGYFSVNFYMSVSMSVWSTFAEKLIYAQFAGSLLLNSNSSYCSTGLRFRERLDSLFKFSMLLSFLILLLERSKDYNLGNYDFLIHSIDSIKLLLSWSCSTKHFMGEIFFWILLELRQIKYRTEFIFYSLFKKVKLSISFSSKSKEISFGKFLIAEILFILFLFRVKVVREWRALFYIKSLTFYIWFELMFKN